MGEFNDKLLETAAETVQQSGKEAKTVMVRELNATIQDNSPGHSASP
jgi:hypothetical protein